MAKPIPEGKHALTPYLNIKGADKAVEFYKKAFGAEEVTRMLGPGGALMHCELRIGDSYLMLSEAMHDPPTVGGIHFYTTDCDAIFKRAIAAGATEKMAPADMFWGDRFGSLTDPFGNRWSIATHKEDLSEAEQKKRGEAFFAQMAAQQKK